MITTKPLRVLHVCDKFGVAGSSIHGISRLFAWWFPRFDRARYDVRLIGLRPADAACRNLERQGIGVHSLNKSKFDVSTALALVREIRCWRADLVHLHGYGASNFGRIAARITGVKAIVHEHFVDPAMEWYQVPFDYALSRWTDRGIAVSQSVKAFMVTKRFMPAERVDVVFNGAPLEDFRPANGELADAERRRWGIPRDCAVVGTVGRVDEQKGNRYFIEAAAQVIRNGHRVKFMVVGDGPLVDALKAQCRRLGIARDVVFTGFQSDIRALQSLLTIQVFPSLWEGTPLTLFEAMATQRPIVATTVDGLGEVLRDGENARLVPPRDPAQLASAIEDLLTHPQQSEQLAAQARTDSRSFDIQHTVDRIQQMYDELIRPTSGLDTR